MDAGELTGRARELVGKWRRRKLGGHGRLLDEAQQLLDETEQSGALEPLIALLELPDTDAARPVNDRVVDLLARAAPASVEPVLRVAGDERGPASERALDALASMDADACARGLLLLLSGDHSEELREAALAGMALRGRELAEPLRRATHDPELGAVAGRCLKRLDAMAPVWDGREVAPALRELADAYLEARSAADATYALDALGELLRERAGDLDEACLAELERLPRNADTQVVLDLAGVPADDDDADQAGDQDDDDGHEDAEDHGGADDDDDLWDLPVDELLERRQDPGATPRLDRLLRTHFADRLARGDWAQPKPQTSWIGFSGASQAGYQASAWSADSPAFGDWAKPHVPLPSDDGTRQAGYRSLLLTILANDAEWELKSEAALMLVGDRPAVPLVQALLGHEAAGDWATLVLDCDGELAAAENVTLAAWSEGLAPPEPSFVDELRDGPAEGEAGPAADHADTPADDTVTPADDTVTPASGNAAVRPTPPGGDVGEAAAPPDAPLDAPLDAPSAPDLAQIDGAYEDYLTRFEERGDG